jgi:hypothetical protein
MLAMLGLLPVALGVLAGYAIRTGNAPEAQQWFRRSAVSHPWHRTMWLCSHESTKSDSAVYRDRHVAERSNAYHYYTVDRRFLSFLAIRVTLSP